MDLISADLHPQSTSDAFEQKIAYFFGVSDEGPVSEGYINGLKLLESVGFDNLPPHIERRVLGFFEDSYRSIAQQRKWNFDIEGAAKQELEIILGVHNGMPIEEIQERSIKLYESVFRSKSDEVHKAVMLRTFLFRYKTELQKNNLIISPADRALMLSLAATSEHYLNHASIMAV